MADVYGVLVRYTGGDVVEYAATDDGAIYDVATYRLLNASISLGEFAERLKSAGNMVTTFGKAEATQREQRRNEARRMKPDYELGVGVPWDNAEYRRAARRSRTASKTMSR